MQIVFRDLDYKLNYFSAVTVSFGWRVGRDPTRQLSIDLPMQQISELIFLIIAEPMEIIFVLVFKEKIHLDEFSRRLTELF